MACRNLHRCQKARHSILHTTTQTKVILFALELDLSSLDSVQRFVDQVQDTLQNRDGQRYDTLTDHPRIHILINNAGIMGTQYAVANDTDAEMQMQVNHLGHFALTSLLLPNLVAATTHPSSLDPWARIVSVSSLMGSYGPALNFDDLNFVKRRALSKLTTGLYGPIKDEIENSSFTVHFAIQSFLQYAASKRANLLFTHGLHQRLYEASNRSLQAVVAHPGYSRTSIVLSGWDFIPLWFRTYFSMNIFGSMSSDDGAMCILRAALDRKVSSDDYVGPLYVTFGRPVILGTSLRSIHHIFWPITNRTEVDRLWTWSESAVGFKFP